MSKARDSNKHSHLNEIAGITIRGRRYLARRANVISRWQPGKHYSGSYELIEALPTRISISTTSRPITIRGLCRLARRSGAYPVVNLGHTVPAATSNGSDSNTR